MIIKIDNQVYEVGNNCDFVAIYLWPQDKENISNMAPDAATYSGYDLDQVSREEAKKKLEHFRTYVESRMKMAERDSDEG